MTNEIRNSKGQFAKGNSGGPGNPYARRVARYGTMIQEEVSDDDFEAIVRALVELAKGGNLAAIRELLARLAGKPSEGPDPDRLDLEELGLKHGRDLGMPADLRKTLSNS